MTGRSLKSPESQPHIRNKPKPRELATTNFKDSTDLFHMVIGKGGKVF